MTLSLAQMLALLPLNTTGEISPSDLRAVVTALYGPTEGTYDDLFADGTLDAAWTTLTVTGSQTIIEGDRGGTETGLSVEFDDIASLDANAIIRSGGTIATGTSIITAVKTDVVAANDIVGVHFSNGTSSSSNLYGATVYSTSSRLVTISGTYDSWSEAFIGTWTGGVGNSAGDYLYLKLEYTAANAWTMSFSRNGIAWRVEDASRSYTMTPTHFGLHWSNSGGASPNMVTFKYFKVELP